jgi:prepilin-type processing-associated H-X9-DG protein
MSPRSLLVLAAILMASCLSPAAQGNEMPVAAKIVDVPSERRDWGEPIGNIHVTFADGHAELWTLKGRCMHARHASSGLVGWTRYSSRNSYGEPVNNIVRVMISSDHWHDFQAGPFIEDWSFTDNDTTIVIKSRGRHGPAAYRQYSLSTGKLIAAAKGITPFAELPAWAQPLADDRP